MAADTTRNTHFELPDAGGSLFAQSWEPLDRVIGGVVIVHGLGEHSTRYTPLAEKLAGEGYLVLAHDQRGHGQSPGKRGHVGDYADLLDDIQRLLLEIRGRLPTGPVFLYGQSLGGNLVLNYVLRRPNEVAGVIASSPLLLPAATPPSWKRGLAHCLSWGWPSFTFRTGIEAAELSHDPDVVAMYEADPRVHDRVSARLAIQMFDAGRWLLAHAAELTTPLLLLHGTADSITDCHATVKFAGLAGDCCALETFPELLHELHWEPQREQILAVVIAWMRDVV